MAVTQNAGKCDPIILTAQGDVITGKTYVRSVRLVITTGTKAHLVELTDGVSGDTFAKFILTADAPYVENLDVHAWHENITVKDLDPSVAEIYIYTGLVGVI